MKSNMADTALCKRPATLLPRAPPRISPPCVARGAPWCTVTVRTYGRFDRSTVAGVSWDVRNAVLLVTLLACLPTAAAQNRDFSLDLTVGTVLGGNRTVGMGGASVALAEQATGLGANPAAPAVRGATANDRFEWDWSLDWLNPDLGDDFDNNGQNDGTGDSAVVTAGLAFELEKWGLGFGLTVAGRSFGEAEIGSTIGWALLARSFGPPTMFRSASASAPASSPSPTARAHASWSASPASRPPPVCSGVPPTSICASASPARCR
jgi:hypothetical protein